MEIGPPQGIWDVFQMLAPVLLYILWRMAKARRKANKRARAAAHEEFSRYKKDLETQYAPVSDRSPLPEKKSTPAQRPEGQGDGNARDKDDDDFIGYNF